MPPSSSSPLGTAWLKVQSTDADDLVNRNEDRRKLLAMLRDYHESGSGRGSFLVTGDRGVGKSILTRTVLKELADKLPNEVVTLVINGRGIGYRGFLKELARRLAEAIRPHAKRWKRNVDPWLDELLLLANSMQITQSQSTSISQKYGVDASVSVDSLITKLSGRFNWEESRSVTLGTQRVLNITDDLLHDAIRETLVRLRDDAQPLTIAVFYDDLDQAFDGRQDGNVEQAIQHVLELQPCLALAHIRTEAMFGNVRRVIDDDLAVSSLPPEELIEMLKRRAQQAKKPEVRDAFRDEAALKPFRQLASICDNTLAFLRWSQAVISLWGVSPPADWREDHQLRSVVLESTSTGDIDTNILVEFAKLVDHCSPKGGLGGCQLDDLRRGGPSIGTLLAPVEDVVLERMQTLDLLVRRSMMSERHVYRLEPTLELLRPSVANRLRAEP